MGAVLIASISGLMLLDGLTGHGWGVIALGALLVFGGTIEMGRMLAPHTPIPARCLAVTGALFTVLRGAAHELDPRLGLLLLPIALTVGGVLCFGCLRGSPSLPRLYGLAMGILTFVYLPLVGGFAVDVRFLDPQVGPAAFFYLVSIAKGTDICAFFAGKAFGRVKLVPGVSPGKTTAGFVGAVAGAALITVLFSLFTSLGRWLPLPLAPGVGILMALVVIAGDLIESFLKRAVEVKDSASLLPGYGGVLDVIDSVIAAAPPTYYLLLIARQLGPGTA